MVPRAAVSGVRIAEVLQTKVSIVDPDPAPVRQDSGARAPTGQGGLVEFEHVSFRYHGAEADTLSDISFTARPGQTTALIGSTGSGKSTIAHLALRFYDVSGGRILVDGGDIREMSQKDLRSRIGFVPQKGILLSGTIASNLRYGKKDAPDAQVRAAAGIAQAEDFIEARPEGYEAPIAQGGVNVSGGQKQRLSIARALVKGPEIFIFDDSFSALDFKTDAALRRALKEKTGGSTIIVIAQRISTIRNAEQILVLDKGRIAGRGTHDELLKTCREYYEIAASQLSAGSVQPL
jgi:ATP-binding cassette subfamily B protein